MMPSLLFSGNNQHIWLIRFIIHDYVGKAICQISGHHFLKEANSGNIWRKSFDARALTQIALKFLWFWLPPHMLSNIEDFNPANNSLADGPTSPVVVCRPMESLKDTKHILSWLSKSDKCFWYSTYASFGVPILLFDCWLAKIVSVDFFGDKKSISTIKIFPSRELPLG